MDDCKCKQQGFDAVNWIYLLDMHFFLRTISFKHCVGVIPKEHVQVRKNPILLPKYNVRTTGFNF